MTDKVSFGTMWNMPGCWLRGFKESEKRALTGLEKASQKPHSHMHEVKAYKCDRRKLNE